MRRFRGAFNLHANTPDQRVTQHVPRLRHMLAQLAEQMTQTNRPVGRLNRRLNDGTLLSVWWIYGAAKAAVEVPIVESEPPEVPVQSDYAFIVMPRSDGYDGYERQRASPNHLAEPINGLVYNKSEVLKYVDYRSGNIDWVNAEGTLQVSWLGGRQRYANVAHAGAIQYYLTGQVNSTIRLEYDRATFDSTLNGDGTTVGSNAWVNGLFVNAGGYGSMAYVDGENHYFITVTQTAATGGRKYRLQRIGYNPETGAILGYTTLSGDFETDIGGVIDTGDPNPYYQPVFFNEAGTACCTIAAIKISGVTKHRIITATMNEDRTACTWVLGADCVTTNTAITTDVTTGSVGSGSEYSISGWLYPASYSFTRTIEKSYEAIFAVDWCNEELTTAKWTMTQTLVSSKSHPTVTLVGNSGGPGDERLGFETDILTPDDELGDYYGDSAFSESDTVDSSIQISGGWNASYSLSDYTKTTNAGFHISYAPISANGNGTYSGHRRGIQYLDLRYRHIVISDDVESAQAAVASASLAFNNITLSVTYSGTETKSVDSVLFGSSTTTSVGTFDISAGSPFSELNPPQLASEYAASSSSSSTTAIASLSGPWTGNNNWTTVATLADKQTAWLHMAMDWPAISPTLSWSPSNSNSRHWVNRAVGPLAPPSLSELGSAFDLTGGNPRFHAVRPVIITDPQSSPDAPA